MDEIELLWQRLHLLESELRFDGRAYPEGLTAFPGKLRGQGFFPGGDGLWRSQPADAAGRFPIGGIMVLGNDFGCFNHPDPRSPGFLQCLAKGYENPPTWRIKETLHKAGLPADRCFFTNAYLGLRTSIKTTGNSPGLKNPEFRAMCREFFAYQLEVQRPRLIVCLGHEPRKFIAPLLLDKLHAWTKNISFPALDRLCDPIVQGSFAIPDGAISPRILAIAHPSFAWSTHAQSPRWFEGKRGEAAEHALLAAAWDAAEKN